MSTEFKLATTLIAGIFAISVVVISLMGLL